MAVPACPTNRLRQALPVHPIGQALSSSYVSRSDRRRPAPALGPGRSVSRLAVPGGRDARRPDRTARRLRRPLRHDRLDSAMLNTGPWEYGHGDADFFSALPGSTSPCSWGWRGSWFFVPGRRADPCWFRLGRLRPSTAAPRPSVGRRWNSRKGSQRRVVEQIGQAAVDGGVLAPDGRIEAGGQAGPQLRGRQAGDARGVGR